LKFSSHTRTHTQTHTHAYTHTHTLTHTHTHTYTYTGVLIRHTQTHIHTYTNTQARKIVENWQIIEWDNDAIALRDKKVAFFDGVLVLKTSIDTLNSAKMMVCCSVLQCIAVCCSVN